MPDIPAAPVPLRPLRVLVVDNDPRQLHATLDLLAALGHWATGVDTAELACTRWFDGAFDLVMTEVRLPALSGFDLAETLRRGCAVRVLFVTGQPRPAARLPARTGWLAKPFGRDELAAALDALLTVNLATPSAAPAHPPERAVIPAPALQATRPPAARPVPGRVPPAGSPGSRAWPPGLPRRAGRPGEAACARAVPADSAPSA